MNVDDECPGEGKCHGCMCWCDRCGDVDEVCDYPECDQHHCQSCHEMLGRDDRYNFGQDVWAVCETCSLFAINDDAIISFERALERGDFPRCDMIARDLVNNPTPRWPVMVPWSSRPMGAFS